MAIIGYRQVRHSGIRAMTKKKQAMTLSQGEQGRKSNDISGWRIQVLSLAVTNDLTDEEMCFSWQVTTSPLCARLHLMKPERRFPGLFENGKAWFMLLHGHLQTGTGDFSPNPMLPVWGTQQVSPAQPVPASILFLGYCCCGDLGYFCYQKYERDHLFCLLP